MKITDLSSTISSTNAQKITSHKNSDVLQASFLSYLSLTEKPLTGDAYYLAHQEQLQRSALHFKPLIKKISQPLEEKFLGEKSSRQSKEQSASKIEKKNCTQASSKEALNPLASLSLSALNPGNLAEKKDPIKQREQNFLGSIEKPLEAIKQNPTKTLEIELQALINQKLAAPNLVFKNMHCFLQGHRVDISFNSQGLNKEQINSLKKIIQFELNAKNYVLKQLIINGVRQ